MLENVRRLTINIQLMSILLLLNTINNKILK